MQQMQAGMDAKQAGIPEGGMEITPTAGCAALVLNVGCQPWAPARSLANMRCSSSWLCAPLALPPGVLQAPRAPQVCGQDRGQGGQEGLPERLQPRQDAPAQQLGWLGGTLLFRLCPGCCIWLGHRHAHLMQSSRTDAGHRNTHLETAQRSTLHRLPALAQPAWQQRKGLSHNKG